MFVRGEWRLGEAPREREGRIRTALGTARWCVEVHDGKASLGIHIEPRGPETVVSASRYTALGVLGLIRNALPRFSGTNTVIRVSALNREWLDSADTVLELLGTVGLAASAEGRVLEVRGQGSPAEIIPRLGVCLLALDVESRKDISEKELDELRLACVRLLPEGSEEILKLLGEDGDNHVRQLFFGRASRPSQSGREESIISTLKKSEVRQLVHFHSGNGAFLRRIAQSSQIALERLCGVEPSLIRVQRTNARNGDCFRVQHGSVVEPPEGLPHNSLALLIDALPARDDSRLERAVEALCGRCRFEWILCVRSVGASDAVGEFAQICCERFGYKSGAWSSGGDTMLLLRRKGDLPGGATRRESSGGCSIENRVVKPVRLQPVQWKSTLEAFGLRTVDPRWLIYLPSGLASIQNERRDGALEHPEDAFAYYRGEQVHRLVVEKKHMGSRAIAVICRDPGAAKEYFGLEQPGCIYTRNGRPFFREDSDFLNALREGLSRGRFWERFKTDWVCLDGEILPWSVKAERLISENHRETLETGEAILDEIDRAPGWMKVFKESLDSKKACFNRYRRLLDKYEAEAASAVCFAPFHMIATEGRSYFDKNHHWQMQTLNALAKAAGEPFLGTPFERVDLRVATDIQRVLRWWECISPSGEEGLVVKPLHFLCRGRRGLAQPGIKCRGREHLRLVYGPEYDSEENIVKLLDRRAISRRRQKHRRILKQLALSIEGVERFIRKEPLPRVEECVRGVLSLETREISAD